MTVGKRQGFIIINLRACMYIKMPLSTSHPSPSFLHPSSRSCVSSFVFEASACIRRRVSFFHYFLFSSLAL